LKDKLELIASREFKSYEDMYKIVDFFNKNLDEMGLTFGLSEREGVQIISIYKISQFNWNKQLKDVLIFSAIDGKMK